MADYNALRLKYHGDPAKLDEILQAECREKCMRKLPGLLSCEGFRFPSTAVAEMSTSESVAHVHSEMADGAERVLDMTFGLGVDTFALAGRTSRVDACELDEHTYQTGCHNIEALGLENVTLHHADSVKWLQESPEIYDIIFIDPARRNRSGRHVAFADCEPNLVDSLPLLLSHCKRLIIKASPMIDISAAKAELGIREARVSVIGTSRECKEVILELAGAHSSRPLDATTQCVTVGHDTWTFSPDDTTPPPLSTEMPEPGDWLLEPYPSLMKAGASRSLGRIDGVKSFHPNTHLFWSKTRPENFPGEAFRIERVLPFNKQGMKEVVASHPMINVAVRNFPMTAPELVKKLKIKEGGTHRLFGLTHAPNQRYMVVCGAQ